MQKLSADRKLRSLIHLRSSTSTRCMSAICAAGPPNDMRPILAKTPSASRSEGVPDEWEPVLAEEWPMRASKALGDGAWATGLTGRPFLPRAFILNGRRQSGNAVPLPGTCSCGLPSRQCTSALHKNP